MRVYVCLVRNNSISLCLSVQERCGRWGEGGLVLCPALFSRALSDCIVLSLLLLRLHSFLFLFFLWCLNWFMSAPWFSFFCCTFLTVFLFASHLFAFQPFSSLVIAYTAVLLNLLSSPPSYMCVFFLQLVHFFFFFFHHTSLAIARAVSSSSSSSPHYTSYCCRCCFGQEGLPLAANR